MELVCSIVAHPLVNCTVHSLLVQSYKAPTVAYVDQDPHGVIQILLNGGAHR